MNAVAPLSLFCLVAAAEAGPTERVLAVPSTSFVVDLPLGTASPAPVAPVVRLTPQQRAALREALGVDVTAIVVRPDKVRRAS